MVLQSPVEPVDQPEVSVISFNPLTPMGYSYRTLHLDRLSEMQRAIHIHSGGQPIDFRRVNLSIMHTIFARDTLDGSVRSRETDQA